MFIRLKITAFYPARCYSAGSVSVLKSVSVFNYFSGFSKFGSVLAMGFGFSKYCDIDSKFRFYHYSINGKTRGGVSNVFLTIFD